MVVLACTGAALALGGDVLVGIGRQLLGAGTFSSNWLAIATGTSYFTGTTPDLFRNLWSLAVEEQFYLVWPFVVLVVAMLRWRWARFGVFVLIAAASAVEMALLYSPRVDPTRVYYGTDTHSFGLARRSRAGRCDRGNGAGIRWSGGAGCGAPCNSRRSPRSPPSS